MHTYRSVRSDDCQEFFSGLSRPLGEHATTDLPTPELSESESPHGRHPGARRAIPAGHRSRCDRFLHGAGQMVMASSSLPCIVCSMHDSLNQPSIHAAVSDRPRQPRKAIDARDAFRRVDRLRRDAFPLLRGKSARRCSPRR